MSFHSAGASFIHLAMVMLSTICGSPDRPCGISVDDDLQNWTRPQVSTGSLTLEALNALLGWLQVLEQGIP
jgi:hypothetical protein